MFLKLEKLKTNIEIVPLLIFFFLLLDVNCAYFYSDIKKNIHSFDTQVIFQLKEFIISFISNFNYSKLSIYFFLILIGLKINISKMSYSNFIFSLFCLIFFFPFLIFFYEINHELYRSFTLKPLFQSSDQFIADLNKYFIFYSFVLINLFFFVFFSNCDFKIKIKLFDININKIKLICLCLIILLITLFVINIFNSYENYKLNVTGEKKFFKKFTLRTELTGFFGYIYYWSIYLILPLYYLLQDSKIIKILVLLIYFLFFLFFESKVTLLMIFLILCSSKINIILNKSNYFRNLTAICSIFLFISFILSFFLNYYFQLDTSMYFERIFLTQAKNLFLTYDFVQNHNYIYLTNNKLFSSYYPYEYDFYNLIRNIYGGGTAVSNSFIIEGFASFGIFGLFLVSTVLIILFKFIDSVEDFSKIKLNLLYIFQAICFLSYPISTHLITYGLLPFILISLIKLKK